MPAPDQPGSRSHDRHIVDAASDAIVTIDRQGIVLTANPAVEMIFGWAPDTLIGKNIEVLVSPEVRERQKEDLRVRRDDVLKKAVTYPGVRQDGSHLNLEISFGEFHEGAREDLIGVIRDVSEGVESQRRLAQSEEMFRDFFENAPVGCHSLGSDGRFTSINRTELELLGYEYSEVVDKLTWKNLIIPEQHELFDKHWRLLEAQGKVLDVEYTVLDGDADVLSASANDDKIAWYENLSEWTNLGGGTVGIAGTPKLVGNGALVGGTVASLRLTEAAPFAAMLAWVSFNPTPFPALGGTVHAFPFANQILLFADVDGDFSVTTTWPPGIPPGTNVWFQFVLEDLSTIHGLTLSNGLLATTP